MNNAWRMNEGANKRWNDKGWGNQYEKAPAGKGRAKEPEVPTRFRQGAETTKRTTYPSTPE